MKYLEYKFENERIVNHDKNEKQYLQAVCEFRKNARVLAQAKRTRQISHNEVILGDLPQDVLFLILQLSVESKPVQDRYLNLASRFFGRPRITSAATTADSISEAAAPAPASLDDATKTTSMTTRRNKYK